MLRPDSATALSYCCDKLYWLRRVVAYCCDKLYWCTVRGTYMIYRDVSLLATRSIRAPCTIAYGGKVRSIWRQSLMPGYAVPGASANYSAIGCRVHLSSPGPPFTNVKGVLYYRLHKQPFYSDLSSGGPEEIQVVWFAGAPDGANFLFAGAHLTLRLRRARPRVRIMPSLRGHVVHIS